MFFHQKKHGGKKAYANFWFGVFHVSTDVEFHEVESRWKFRWRHFHLFRIRGASVDRIGGTRWVWWKNGWTSWRGRYIYIYTWNPNDPCFDRKRHCFGGLNGWPSKIEVSWVLGTYISQMLHVLNCCYIIHSKESASKGWKTWIFRGDVIYLYFCLNNWDRSLHQDLAEMMKDLICTIVL